jgi:protein-L-isoaspartate O-methyltransferase
MSENMRRAPGDTPGDDMAAQATRAAFIAAYNADFFGKAQAAKTRCLCGSARMKLLFDKDRYGLKSPTVICRDCGLVFTSPRPSQAFLRDFYQSDTYRYFYEEAASEADIEARCADRYRDDNFIHATCATYLSDIAASHRPRVLEVGAGGGWNLVPFLRSCDVTGIEFSPMLCDMARARGISLLCGGLERLSEMDRDFDLIIANHVVEHFTDFFADMRTVLTKLANKGLLYVGVPDIDHFNESQIQNAHNYYFSGPTLIHYCGALGLVPLQAGRDDSQIHQYAIFRATPRCSATGTNDLSSEYRRMVGKFRRYWYRDKAASALDALGLRQTMRAMLRRT